MDERSLQLIEYSRVTAAVAERATSVRGRAVLAGWKPIAEMSERVLESDLLAEAMRRASEPGPWCGAGRGDLIETLDRLSEEGPEGAGLLDVLDWIEAARSTAMAWTEAATRTRYARLVTLVPEPEPLEGVRRRLADSLERDGSVRDGASPILKRLRSEALTCERRLADHLERWAKTFGPDAYVTRQGERFVAMVPAAGFPRRRAIVHDVSGSGQSLLVEPIESCAENNRMIESRRAALDEERRILAELGQLVEDARPVLESMEASLVHLDTLRARALWALDVGAHAVNPSGDALRLVRARHPLLAMGVGRESRDVVPLDLELHSADVAGKVLLVSGPNMGGKTVLLKTVGLAVALAHSAFPVTAAEGSLVPEIEVLLVDMGDDQSIERGLSTFAAHLRAWSAMAAAAGPRTMVLVDEVAAGTDPEDGAALARALIEHLARAGTWAVVTTHLGSLKRLAGEVEGVENGSLEFDVSTLSPRYRFLAGVPGASHALEVAERLGVPPDVLVRARTLRPEGAATADRLLAELAEATRQAREASERLTAAAAESEAQAALHREAVEHAKREEAELRRRLTRESEAVLARARAVWQDLMREARRAEKQRGPVESTRREITEVERAVEALAGSQTAANGSGAPVDPAELKPGARLRVLDLGVEAELVSGPDAEGRVELQRGSWKIQSHVRKLAAVSARGSSGPPTVTATWSSPEAAPIEVDLRGKDVSDALADLDRGVDRAVLAGLAEVRVIHGVGRGVLRGAVERHLREHPQVAGIRAGQVGEGGRGVTVAKLK